MIDYPAINLADYEVTADMTDDQFVARLADPLFRICNIYSIEDPNGQLVSFTPNWAQRVILHAVYIQRRKRIVIPKARQLGFSTLIALIAFDTAYWRKGQQCSIVDQTKDDAEEKLAKVTLAFEHLDEELRHGAGVLVKNRAELAWSNGGSVAAGKNARGGTNQVLHVSELGPIAYEDPRRAQEIISGAIPSASGEGAVIFVESTYKGGRGGEFHEILELAWGVPDNLKTDLDWHCYFFPWYLEPRYRVSGNMDRITDEDRVYFRDMEAKTGYQFAPEQMLWYVIRKAEQGRWMKREFPTIPEEMWSVHEEGMIYAAALDRARVEGRVHNHVRHYDGLPVYVAFDIGAPINTKAVVFQIIGDRIVFLEALSGGEGIETPADWSKRLRERSWDLGGIFLPHDGEVLWLRLLRDAGMQDIKCLPRPADIWDPIRNALQSFSRCEFHEDGCDDLIKSLGHYHSKQERDGMTITDKPVHDWSSHQCSAFAYAHEAINLGWLAGRAAMRRSARNHERPAVVTARPRETAVDRVRRMKMRVKR